LRHEKRFRSHNFTQPFVTFRTARTPNCDRQQGLQATSNYLIFKLMSTGWSMLHPVAIAVQLQCRCRRLDFKNCGAIKARRWQHAGSNCFCSFASKIASKGQKRWMNH